MTNKIPSIISTVITVILLLLFGALSVFMMLVALNGFSSHEGGPALITVLVCNVAGVVASALIAWRLPHWFITKFNWNSILAVVFSVLAGLFFGGVLSSVAMIVGVIVAESIWNAR